MAGQAKELALLQLGQESDLRARPHRGDVPLLRSRVSMVELQIFGRSAESTLASQESLGLGTTALTVVGHVVPHLFAGQGHGPSLPSLALHALRPMWRGSVVP